MALGLFGGNRKPVNRIINRDPNNEVDLAGVSIKESLGVRLTGDNIRARSGGRLGRGEAVRSALTYNRTLGLGHGEVAKKVQAKAFTKLRSAGVGSGGGGLNRNINLFK